MRRNSSVDEPFAWWGPVWDEPVRHSLSDLIRDDVITLECAALLSVILERRGSMVIAAGPSGAGKTTFLTAFADRLPDQTRKIYIRGSYEPFDFLATANPTSSTLMVNEISPHLPIYLWGPGIRRVLNGIEQGFQLLATAHAESVDEFVYSLAGYPLRVPAADIARIDLLVMLDAWRDDSGVRREVRSVVNLSDDDRQRLSPVSLAKREFRSGPLIIDEVAARDTFRRIDGTGEDFDDAMSPKIDEIEKTLARTTA